MIFQDTCLQVYSRSSKINVLVALSASRASTKAEMQAQPPSRICAPLFSRCPLLLAPTHSLPNILNNWEAALTSDSGERFKDLE